MLAVQRSGFNTSDMQLWLWQSQQLSASLHWPTNTLKLRRCQLCPHTIGRIWYVPSPSASTNGKSLSPKSYQTLSAYNLNYPGGEFQSWLILNTKLERDWLPSFLHIFYCLNRIQSTGGNMKYITFWATFMKGFSSRLLWFCKIKSERLRVIRLRNVKEA